MDRISIVACARWESAHIHEWVAYHLCLGVDHIYLYCNDDDPKEMYKEIAVFCNGSSPKVTFLHYPFQGEQWQMYCHFLNYYKGASEFICFLDIDEFITLRKSSSIHEYLDQFNHIDWDVLFLNWVNFGPNGYQVRPEGEVLKNYTARSSRMNHVTKVIVRTQSINNDFIKTYPVPFWHGLDIKGLSAFNYGLKSISANGDSYLDFIDRWWELYLTNPVCDEILAMEQKILNNAYVSHFLLKSLEDVQWRVNRGTKGNFTGQWDWINKVKDPKELEKYLNSLNEVTDEFLKNTWIGFHTPKRDNYFIPLAPGKNLSAGCFCDQSSVSIWSGNQESTQKDACLPVNMIANGMHKHHTAVEDNPWWYIDLGVDTNIKEIRLFHRKAREVEIRNFKIEISNNKEEWFPIYTTKRDCPFGGIDGSPFILPLVNIHCRYVKIVLNHYGALHFDRIEIY